MIPLQGKALTCLNNPSPSIEAYEGAVRSSKTTVALLDWLRFIREGPQGNLAMCGRTERTVINNMILPLQEMIGADRVTVNYGTGTATILGRNVMLFGANNEQSRTKIQGLTLAGAMVDEAGVVVESFFNMLYSRLSVKGAKLWLTANPEGPNHWLKVKWLDRARLWVKKDGSIEVNEQGLDLHRYTFMLEDNPALDPEYVQRLKETYTGVFHRRFIESEWVMAEGIIFPNFDPTHHVVPWHKLPEMSQIMAAGVDYGTMNPTAVIILGLGVDGNLYAVDEWSYSGRDHKPLTDKQLADRLVTFLEQDHAPGDDRQPDVLIVDPSAKNFSVELTLRGMRVIPADNDVTYGIRTVASLFGGYLYVSDRCKRLINELPSYAWDEKALDLHGKEQPIKVHDHAVDALRYAVVTTERYWRGSYAMAS